MTYAGERLWEELAYVAYYLHWSFDSILDLDHPTRQRIVAEVGKIHSQVGAQNEGW
ncbi:DUF6760 family protein [Solihabitans fulvus]|uniref:DUF6760 family protein n=1 Tax=Solihabitans fulvus TaxID=1892852 RepID=UPI0016618BA1|nr:DUF6760 family protein [Solihabitans fulvus]